MIQNSQTINLAAFKAKLKCDMETERYAAVMNDRLQPFELKWNAIALHLNTVPS